MREALASPTTDFFFAPVLCHPVGLDLTLHSHTALHALIGATLFRSLPLPEALNLLVLGSLALNAFGAYACAWSAFRSRSAALVAAMVFGGAPFFTAHLLGHFNLVAGYGLPLAALATLWLLRRASVAAGMGLAVTLAAGAYVDYYHCLFAVALVATLVATAYFRPAFEPRPRSPRAQLVQRCALAGLALLLVLGVWVAVSGGFSVRFGGLSLSIRGTFNLQTYAELLIFLLLASRWRLRLLRLGDATRGAGIVIPAAVAASAFALAVLPLIARAFRLWRQGEYVSQTYFWRSAPPGLDLTAIAVPHPQNPFVGETVRALYGRFQLDPIETTGIGLIPVLLLIWAWKERARDDVGARWWLIGAFFFIWSLGPFLRVAGVSTGIVGPQTVLRYVPIVANARIPGRAIVVVQLATAMLLAGQVAAIANARRRRLAGLAVLCAIGLEYSPGRFPTYELPRRRVYAEIARTAAGAVLQLPLGIQDGFGVRGRFDPETLWAQATHRRPILGGAASRVPKSVDAVYDRTPVIRTVFRLSAGQSIDAATLERDRQQALATFRHLGITHILLNRALAGETLCRYVTDVLPVTLVMKDGDRELYSLLS